MARPKRMGAYNALDDLLPGPAWGPDPGPDGLDDEPAPRWRRPRLEPVPNALDDLLPGPSVPERRPETAWSRPSASGGETPAGRFAGRAGRHLGVWNPLDGPPPAPAPVPPGPEPVPAKVRVSFRLPADVVETARDAIAHLAATPDRTTLTALAERALRVELARLAITHNHGRPFPSRDA